MNKIWFILLKSGVCSGVCSGVTNEEIWSENFLKQNEKAMK